MLLDLSHLVIIISDLVDSLIQLIEDGSLTFAFPVAGNFVCFILIIGVILYFAWRSTDIPDLPPVPPRLFGGTITTDHGGRPHISGVRVGVVDRIDVNAANGPVIDSVIRSFPQRHHHTQHHQHNHGRHGTLFLRFLRRPQSRPLLPIPPQVGSRFQQAPNLIVYHQVSVYHHTHLPPERIQGRNVNVNLNTASTSSSSTTNSGATSSINNNNNSESIQVGVNITPPLIRNTTTNITSEGSAIHENAISSSSSTPLESSSINNNNNSNSSRGQSIENNSLGELNNRSSTRLNETRRSLSENNLADLEVETEESTVDVVELEVDDLNEVDGSLRVVDVNLNGDVQLDGLNLNINSNLVTMNRNHHNPNNSNAGNTIHSSSSNNNPISNSSNSASPSNDSNNSSTTDNNASMAGNSSREHGNASRNSKNDQSGQQQPTSTNNSNTDKSVNSGSSDVRVILKFLNDTQIEVTTQLSEKISEFKRRHFATELSENKVVRLIFNGRVLDDDRTTLQESGIFDQCVVHCLIVTPQTSNQQQRGGQSNSNQTNGPSGRTSRRNGLREGPEPGMFFIAILGIVLLFLWFICLHFRQLFTQSAVVSLLILSVVFVFGLVALYLPVQN